MKRILTEDIKSLARTIRICADAGDQKRLIVAAEKIAEQARRLKEVEEM